ncbi:MAG TPA: NADH-quinone oxidoreductase subunit NuoG [Spirochaetia bacterium]|nr:NADH-quinone oxidoreductase subunit NuoG [Spirochaetia bacterium]
MKQLAITVDGRRYDVEGEGKNLLQICLSLGFNLPYFCWHPALHSVGACRQCAVKVFRDASDTRGRIVMSCMTPVTDGMRVAVDDPEAAEMRARVTEWLMVNHPHDCPICDEGGECHLQDMTVMTGHTYRRYRFPKRTHRNQDLGPFLSHEMNRCIQCYRCVRFYRDYAGGRDLEVQGWHDNVYFGRHEDGALENEFSGNLVEVCPTGVFTDKTFREHFTRKWDLQTAPSVCTHCAVGCNTIPGERYGMLRRVRTRFNGEVNGYFLCDRGRYGYEFVNGPFRVRQPMVRKESALTAVEPADAFGRAAEAVTGGRLVGIGSSRASVETNFALRDLVGPESFYLGVSDARFALMRQMLDILSNGPAPSASLREAGSSDAVIVLGEDVWNTAPILALTLRQAAINVPVAAAMKQKRINRWEDAALREAIHEKKGPFYVATVEPTELDNVAAETFRASPREIARLGFAAAHEIDSAAPAVEGLSDEARILSQRIARAFMLADKPLVVSGCGLGSPEIVHAAANLARALKAVGKDARVSFVFPEANSFAAVMMAHGGIESARKALSEAGDATLVIAENDLFREVDAGTAGSLLVSASHVIAVDHTANATTEKADVLLPSTTYAESSGTLVSLEGRAQRFFAVFPPTTPAREAWIWLGELAVSAGKRTAGWGSLDAILAEIPVQMPELAKVQKIAPHASFRMVGQPIPRKSHRESGRTAVTAHIDLHEPKPAQDNDSPLAFTMEGRLGQPPSSLITRFWFPGWNSDQSVNKFQIEVGGPLRGGDPGVRIIEPSARKEGDYFPSSPAEEAPAQGLLLIIARHSVFGSDELSVLSRGIASRTPAPHVAINKDDAVALGLTEGQQVRVVMEGRGKAGPSEATLPVLLRDLPRGIASVPWGVPGMTLRALPALARVSGGSA